MANTKLASDFLLQAIGEPSGIERLQPAMLGHYASDEGRIFESGGARFLRNVPNLREIVRNI